MWDQWEKSIKRALAGTGSCKDVVWNLLDAKDNGAKDLGLLDIYLI